jgi:hypothetical protein
MSSKAPLMATTSRVDLGKHREGTMAGYSSPYINLKDSKSTVTGTGTERVPSTSPYRSNKQV